MSIRILSASELFPPSSDREGGFRGLDERFILKTGIQQEETEKTENERLKSSDLRKEVRFLVYHLMGESETGQFSSAMSWLCFLRLLL